MIKIFGKVRYHWQPDLAWSISYWSLVLMPFLLYLILLYERSRIPIAMLVILVLAFVFVVLGLQRYFVIEPDGHLKITSANPLESCRIAIASITKIEVTYSSITLFSEKYPTGRVFYMRKWPKKYFINALALVEDFQGEVVLTDHLIKMDYFEVYYSERTKRS
ncbi:EbsA family protein [Streptococcus ovuberis]|uniref:EbsA family protein n=1 Tax=Streptococcus ovuberis TaxID=1936207 RepID=A0A7X6N2F3_9STRE|nr:EbsA family protein [Streptococcus ovuberis]NKZ20902.1 EbsA family protein [Streptococcus ovuberis]